jgi:hypothetical protein
LGYPEISQKASPKINISQDIPNKQIKNWDILGYPKKIQKRSGYPFLKQKTKVISQDIPIPEIP